MTVSASGMLNADGLQIRVPTWCAGCDQLRPVLLMCWTPDGLYRCHPCAAAVVTVDPDGKGPRVWADFRWKP